MKFWALLALLWLTGCPEADVVRDTGPKDIGFQVPDLGVDAGRPDAAPGEDADQPDAPAPDAEPKDAESIDAEVDGGEVDSGELDSGEADAEELDAGEVPDVGPDDVGVPPPAPVAEGTLAFTKILAVSSTSDALEITNVSTAAVRLDTLVVRVASATAGGDLPIFAANDPTGGGAIPVVLLAGASATGVANRGVNNAGADFLIGAALALPEDFLASGDEVEVANPGSDLIDAVDFTSTSTSGVPGPSRFPLVLDEPLQLDLQSVTASAAAENDDGANWCVDRANGVSGVHTDCERFLINELLYDFDSFDEGSDQGQEFVEIAGPIGGDMSGLLLTGVEGTGAAAGTVDREVPLGVLRMPIDGGGYFVIADDDGGSTDVPNADLVVNLDLENGPDAVQLVLAPAGGAAVLLDAVAYGNVVAAIDLTRGLPVGEGTPTTDPTPTAYAIDFARAGFADTNDNLADFAYDPSPTPGADNDGANFAITTFEPRVAPAGATVEVTLTGTDFTDQMTLTFAQVPPPAVTCTADSVNTLVCTVTYPAVPPVGAMVDVTVAARAELGATVLASFLWVGANNETDTGPECDFCNLQFPNATTTAAGVATQTIYGQIYEAGLTDVTTGGAAPGIIVELGYGPAGADPRTSADWIWSATTFNVETGPGGNNDEYQGTLTVPAAGSYLYTYRYSLDGGINFTYGDSDGAGSNGGLGFEVAQLGALTVN